MYLNAAECIRLYKETLDNQYIMDIIVAFEPLLNKYSRKFTLDDQPDIKQELIITIIVAVNKMQKFDVDGECVNYIKTSIKNRYHKLLEDEIKVNKIEYLAEYMEDIVSDKQDEQLKICEIVCCIKKSNTQLSIRKQQMLLDLFVNFYTESQIAERYGVTRQYVNRIKREFIAQIKKCTLHTR